MADNPNMANRNKSLQLKKFKRIASKALRVERERCELEIKLSNSKSNKVIRDTQPEMKDLHLLPPVAVKRPSSRLMAMGMRPCSQSQPPSFRKMMSIPHGARSDDLPARRLDRKLIGRLSDDIFLLGRRSQDDHLYHQQRIRRTQDDQIFARRPTVQQHRSKDDNIMHRRTAKHLQEHAHQQARVATAAAAAAASTVVAQIRKDAIDAVARQQAPYMRMAALASTRPNSSNPNPKESDQRRLIRNSNLLSSALSIIREMDPAFLETLCYAIHDQVSKEDPPESD
ncbi:PREDICTED: uncharacterized protein LOC108618882 [Drosophila arizonae]|uniref:Uncharacterized protein LOC108618882 n=1 Tax=Drosophila arizonae TaxID=7263 RepID=A0ABM1PTN6_DROAR|nr:PREDICTED: uncharacterized protein LOC108618882 [Drosophila arizonae]